MCARACDCAASSGADTEKVRLLLVCGLPARARARVCDSGAHARPAGSQAWWPVAFFHRRGLSHFADGTCASRCTRPSLWRHASRLGPHLVRTRGARSRVCGPAPTVRVARLTRPEVAVPATARGRTPTGSCRRRSCSRGRGALRSSPVQQLPRPCRRLILRFAADDAAARTTDAVK